MFKLFVFGVLASFMNVCLASGLSPGAANGATDAPSMVVILKGEILPGELNRIKQDIESELSGPPESYGQRLFVLASYGDDSDEAMRIGRYIREIKGTTMVPETGLCYSACVFILAGGVERIIEGPVAINQPDFERQTGTPEQDKMNRILSLTSDYFQEMNIPPSLTNEMYVVPPSELRLLSESELFFYFFQ